MYFARALESRTTIRALSVAGWPYPSGVAPISNPQPARAAKSPSPVASMKTGARHAWRPDFDSVTIVSMFLPDASRYTAVTGHWSVNWTPASSIISSQMKRMYSGS